MSSPYRRFPAAAASFAALALSMDGARAEAARPFALRAVDAATGSPVPLVEFESTHGLSWVTDNTGTAAVDAPELFALGGEVFFHVRSHGYEREPDGFGFRGVQVELEPGGEVEVRLKRTQIAERLRRLTGAGLTAERAKFEGRAEPAAAGGVFGCDSVFNATYRGRLFWVWGDTNRAGYPLGNFDTTAATTPLPGAEGFDPGTAPSFDYFGDGGGFVARAAPIPGDGPTWLTALATLRDAEGGEHLVATYAKIEPPLRAYERGLCEWDAGASQFRKVLAFDAGTPFPEGHAFEVERDGARWMYFGEAVPSLRMPATYEAWRDPSTYQPVEADAAFRDAESGRRVEHHHGCVAWNPHRGRWTTVFTEEGGEASYLGDLWYAESDAPEGPWRDAVMVASHERYSFYNPAQHPQWTGEGRYLYFEGTFTRTFSKTERPVPRYDYNQILYRIDLDDPRLAVLRK